MHRLQFLARCPAGMALLAALVSIVLCAGCAQRYRLTLTSGSIIDTKTKPKIDPSGQVYQFKDALGQDREIPAFRVKEIAPR